MSSFFETSSYLLQFGHLAQIPQSIRRLRFLQIINASFAVNVLDIINIAIQTYFLYFLFLWVICSFIEPITLRPNDLGIVVKWCLLYLPWRFWWSLMKTGYKSLNRLSRHLRGSTWAEGFGHTWQCFPQPGSCKMVFTDWKKKNPVCFYFLLELSGMMLSFWAFQYCL